MTKVRLAGALAAVLVVSLVWVTDTAGFGLQKKFADRNDPGVTNAGGADETLADKYANQAEKGKDATPPNNTNFTEVPGEPDIWAVQFQDPASFDNGYVESGSGASVAKVRWKKAAPTSAAQFPMRATGDLKNIGGGIASVGGVAVELKNHWKLALMDSCKVMKVIATQGDKEVANSDDNRNARHSGYACIGEVVFDAYSQTEPELAQDFSDGYPEWKMKYLEPRGGAPVDAGTGEQITIDFTNPGKYWIQAKCDDSVKKVFITVVKVELEQVDDNSPISPKNRMCSNAQTDYKNVKYKISIKPTAGYTLKATVTGGAAVTFADGTSSKTGLPHGTVVTLKTPDDATGSWTLAAECEQVTGCDDQVDEEVFKFVLEATKVNSSSGTGVGGTVDEGAGSVDASKVSAPPAAKKKNAGYVRWHYDVKVVADPGIYAGNVKAKATAILKSDGEMTIRNYAPPINWKGASVGVSFDIVSVSVPLHPGGNNYGSSVAGADTQIKYATQPAIQLGDVKHDYLEVGFPLIMPTKSKTWDTSLDQTENDIERIYVVDTPVQAWCKVAAGSNVSKFKYWVGMNVSTYVKTNSQSIASVEIKEHVDNEYKIVP